jgi:hypothetical protein
MAHRLAAPVGIAANGAITPRLHACKQLPQLVKASPFSIAHVTAENMGDLSACLSRGSADPRRVHSVLAIGHEIGPAVTHLRSNFTVIPDFIRT